MNTFAKTAPAHRFKMVVDSVTEQIVWLSYVPKAPTPIVDPTLNYRTYMGHPVIDVYKAYEQFKLFYVPETKSLLVKEQPFNSNQEKERIEFLRYKCQAFDFLTGLFTMFSERIDLSNTTYLDFVNGSHREDWITVYQETYNCSRENAIKLLDFKINEYTRSNFIIESSRMIMMESLKNAKTIDDLKFVYDTTNIKLFNVNGYEIFN